ncbi:MAG: AAA family ATPase [bacterium]|nr:AAA family ATPase [bacterium]
MKEVIAISEKMRRIEADLNDIFPEREFLIRQIIMALLTKEHIMVYGEYGTAKSDLTRTLFETITDGEVFSIALTKFMAESSFIGIPNPKIMAEEGRLEYDVNSGILVADFVELDEFLDASDPTQRTFLGILNERVFKRGRQTELARLHTAVASTNGNPREALANKDDLGAVLDRFLYWSHVGYLKEPESRLKMYAKYLSGSKPAETVSLAELQKISKVVVNPCQITDPEIIEVYDMVIEAVAEHSLDGKVSDRRKCKLTTLLEANAIYHGRYEVYLDDIAAVRYGILDNSDPDKVAHVDEIIANIIETYKVERAKSNPDDAYLDLLGKYDEEVQAVLNNGFDQMPFDELSNVVADLQEIRSKVENITPGLPKVQEKRMQILSDVDALVERAIARFTQSNQRVTI